MRCLSLFLSTLAALNPIWAAQSNALLPQESTVAASPLRVQMVDDPGPAQPLATSTKGYVLQVTNSSGAPVVGVAVALRLPEDGPTGRFANGLRAWVAYSDVAGIARFPVIQWGETAGPVQLKITAAKGPSHAAIMLSQRIGPDPATVSVVAVPAQPPVPLPELPLPAQRSGLPYKPLVGPVEVAAAKPAAPQAPDIETKSATVFQPMADVVPPAATGATAPEEKPHTLKPEPPPPSKQASSEPTVTITNSPTGAGSGESHKKVWVLVAVGAGAGAAALLGILAAHGFGGGGTGTGSTSGVTVGNPTVTITH